MHTVYWVSYVLPRGNNQTECHQAHHGKCVMKPEYGRINVNMAHLDKSFESTEYVDHFDNMVDSLCLKMSSGCCLVATDNYIVT